MREGGTFEEALMERDSHGEQHNFSFWVGVAFSVNFIMGCGFLGIPSAFVKSGIVLGPILILIGGVLMNSTKDYVLEAMARAEALAKAGDIAAMTVRDARAGRGGTTRIRPSDTDYLVSSTRKFEITDLFVIFVGPRARSLYALILSLYMYGGLTSYTSVWAASFSANVPILFLNGGATCNVDDSFAACRGPYTLWLLVFASMAIPLACMDLEEQVIVQVTMFGARLLVVLLLTGTVLGGLGCNGVVFAELAPGVLPATPLADLSGLRVIIPVAIYAFIFHHSIPGLSQPLANKRTLPRMFATAFLIITAAYASIGFLVALFFGDAVSSQCSLNWRQYVGCMAAPLNYTIHDPAATAYSQFAFAPPSAVMAGAPESGALPLWSAERMTSRLGAALAALLQQPLFPGIGGGAAPAAAHGPHLAASLGAAPACQGPSSWAVDGTCIHWGDRPLYAAVISFIVLIFPALDVLSAFPLSALTLGNNLMSAVLGEDALNPPPAVHTDGDGGGGAAGGHSAEGGSAGSSGPGGLRKRTLSSGLVGAAALRGGRASRSGSSSERVEILHSRPRPTAPGQRPRPWYLRTARAHRLTKVGFRLLAAVPPVIVAAFVADLGVILQFTGIVGVAIAFIVPATLRIYSFAKDRSVFALLGRALLPSAGVCSEAEAEGDCPALLPSVDAALAALALGSEEEGEEGGDSHALLSPSRRAAAEGGTGLAAAPSSRSSASAPLGEAAAAGGQLSPEGISAACAAAKAAPLRLGELLRRTPYDGEMATPYTSWATRFGGAEIMLVLSILMGGFVFAETLVGVLRGSAS